MTLGPARLLITTALAAGLAVTTTVPASGATATRRAAACATSWGSGTEALAGPVTAGSVHAVRAGRHACFDRLVLDVSGGRAYTGYTVRYVDHVTDDAGAVVPLRGGATIEVRVTATRFHPEDRVRLDVTGFRTFRQVASGAGDTEATTYGLGVRARLPFRVFVLDGAHDPAFSRLVVDVAHRW